MGDGYAYIFNCQGCGGFVTVVADDRRVLASSVDEIVDCLREGYVMERVTSEYVRKEAKWCKCEQRVNKSKVSEG